MAEWTKFNDGDKPIRLNEQMNDNITVKRSYTETSDDEIIYEGARMLKSNDQNDYDCNNREETIVDLNPVRGSEYVNSFQNNSEPLENAQKEEEIRFVENDPERTSGSRIRWEACQELKEAEDAKFTEFTKETQ